MCQACRFRQPVACSGGEREADGRVVITQVAGADEERLDVIACAQDRTDALTVVPQLGLIAPPGAGLVVVAA